MRQEPWQEEADLVGSIVVPHLRKILLEDLLIESSLTHVYDLKTHYALGFFIPLSTKEN